jgi:hypothetical protein
MKLLLSVVGALFALSGAANAADLGGGSYKDNGPAEGHRLWTGAYVAAFVGGEFNSITFANADVGADANGAFGGARIGYDLETPGGFLIGAFAEGAFTGASANWGGYAIDKNPSWGFGVRAGKTLGPWLLYVPVSYVRSSVTASAGAWSKDYDLSGVRTGLGVEGKLFGGWNGFVEAGSTWYDTVDTGFRGVTADNQAIDLRVGVSYRLQGQHYGETLK